MKYGCRAHDYGCFTAQELAKVLANNGYNAAQLAMPKAIQGITPLGEGQMDYTILRDWLHREHPDAALLRDEVILSAAQRDLNFIRAM